MDTTMSHEVVAKFQEVDARLDALENPQANGETKEAEETEDTEETEDEEEEV